MEHLQTQNPTAGGISLPRLGLGTFRMQGDTCRAAVESALGLGYRHLDTAEMYGNEEPSAPRYAASGVARRDLHVTTKVWRENLAPDAIRRAFDASLTSSGSIMSISTWCTGPAPRMDARDVRGADEAEAGEGVPAPSALPISLLRSSKWWSRKSSAPIACNQVEYHVNAGSIEV